MGETVDDDPSLLSDPGARCAFLLSQLGFHVAELVSEVLAPLDLHSAHFGVVSNLARTDGQTQQELADRVGVHRNVMVGLIDGLEERGLVRRERHRDDRRAYHVYLTEDAHTILAKAITALNSLGDQILGPLDTAQRQYLVTLLQRVVTHNGLSDEVHPGIRRRGPAGGRPPVRPRTGRR